MPETDPRVDAYIEKAAPFAKPILSKLRKLIYQACPEVIETIKWSFPNYEVYGSMLCSMAAFKEHCAFGFWKAALLKDPEGILHLAERNAMGHFDKLSSLKDLPAERILVVYLKEAALLNKNNVKIARPKSGPKKELPPPKALAATLKKNKKALAVFEAFSISNRRDYIEWINEAKTEETLNKRLATTIEWLEQGKSRNWKYKKA
ncbi:MAG TPA: YdeI/OmpD-associated family protein [Puia sp.]